MNRMQLFEFEDFRCFPTTMRDYVTDFLQFMVHNFYTYEDLTPVLLRGLHASKTTQIVDIASGGGGGWQRLAQQLKKKEPALRIVLTDLYPNHVAFAAISGESRGIIRSIDTPIDAQHIPHDLVGLRTQFLSFHHFRPKHATAILQNAVDARAPIVIVEIQRRSPKDLMKNFFSPIAVLLATPFIRPFRGGRLFFTYIIPILPVVVWWDGIASVLRTYNENELRGMIDSLENGDTYTWETGQTPSTSAPVYYLAGYPEEVRQKSDR